MRIEKGVIDAPYRGTIYGTTGIGKTSFAAHSESVIFLPTEEGTNELDVARLRNEDGSPITTYVQAKAGIDWLMTENHNFRTLAIDSLDWLSQWIEAFVCEQGDKNGKWTSIESPGYGKGYTALTEEWRLMIALLEKLQRAKRMHVLLVGHAQVKKYSPPDIEPYDRYMLKVPEGVSALIHEWSNFVFFAQHEVVVPKKEGEQKHARGIDTGRRILVTVENASVKAKNRYCMPSVVEFDRDAFKTFDSYRKQDAKKLLEQVIKDFPEAHVKSEKQRPQWEADLREWFSKQPDKLFAVQRLRADFQRRKAQ